MINQTGNYIHTDWKRSSPCSPPPLPLPFLRVRVWKIERLNKTENQISNESIEFEHRFSASLVLGSVRDSWEVSSTYPHTHTHVHPTQIHPAQTILTHTHMSAPFAYFPIASRRTRCSKVQQNGSASCCRVLLAVRSGRIHEEE